MYSGQNGELGVYNDKSVNMELPQGTGLRSQGEISHGHRRECVTGDPKILPNLRMDFYF
jgi:hypothetical protein